MRARLPATVTTEELPMPMKSRSGTVRIKYPFIKSHRKEFTRQAMCRILGVAPSGYNRANHRNSPRCRSERQPISVYLRDCTCWLVRAVHATDTFFARPPGSSKPVGSSQSSTSGCLPIACAIATRCCSPPDICAGKWSIVTSCTCATARECGGDLHARRAEARVFARPSSVVWQNGHTDTSPSLSARGT